ncbi:acyl-[acyl-carrier-protein] thioesterase [Flavobacterium sp. '19STA2R22 D10 B1']|uniref:acyl-[acyl-carrier-protein] thioesterase n=1 Tax=Flavobacterium aerium TaxID=3037261 RepID=UPI00278BB585|nr:acyl-ACP thioesterase domain-containing protein [Flavobacterium sp. '19STA2R22 D10 B1']
MPIAENFKSIHSKDWEIDFTQCTPNGYLKYTDLCNILQLTAADHSYTGGLSFTDMQQYDQAWVLSRIRVEVDELPKWQDTVTVTTWIMDMQGSRSIRALEMYCNGKKIVGATTFWAVFNTKTRRPDVITLPHDHFELFPDKNPTLESFSKVNIAIETHKVTDRKVVLSDLDIVNHVNNVKYLEWCLDQVDYIAIMKQKLRSFDMNFMKELKYGDTVSINENAVEHQSVYTISKEDKICFALQINWK